MADKKDIKNRDFVASLARGLSVLSAFDLQRPRMTLSEVAAAVGMTRATARRYLLTLEKLGYVVADRRKFRLTPQVLNLGYAYIASVPILDVVTPILEDLAAKTGLVTAFSVISNDELVTLAHGSVSRFIATGVSVGTVRPVYSTASGRAILSSWADDEIEAYLDRVSLKRLTQNTITDRKQLKEEIAKTRRNGYAIVDQETQIGIRGIAVPVLDGANELLGAILCVVNPAVTSMERLETDTATFLLEAAKQIQSQIPIYK